MAVGARLAFFIFVTTASFGCLDRLDRRWLYADAGADDAQVDSARDGDTTDTRSDGDTIIEPDGDDSEEARCGDGRCSSEESLCTCPEDCEICGDGECSSQEAGSGSCESDCSGSIVWIHICPTTFMMGSPPEEFGRGIYEDQRQTTLSRSFFMRSKEVTNGAFEDAMGYNPASATACAGRTCPVTFVSWDESVAYCNVLSEEEGRATCYDCTWSGSTPDCELAESFATPYDCPGYRLPTEAEWELAARAGTTTATYNGNIATLQCDFDGVLDPIAWYCGNSGDRARDVGTRSPNPWGLYDMLGNVWEWCHDSFVEGAEHPELDPWGNGAGAFRVLRGGGFDGDARFARAAFSVPYEPELQFTSAGIRPVRTGR